MLELDEAQRQQVIELTYSVIQQPHKIFAYGSRTKGKARPYSDLDLIIKAEEKLSLHTLYKLKDAFEFSDLSFRVDIQDWYSLSDSFKKSIESTSIQIK